MSSVTGLELPNAWRTAQADNPSFDISANELNVTASRELWIPTGTVDWQGALMRNALDPVLAQDLATKNYVDINGGALWSTFPATQNVDMAGFGINDLLDPLLAQDAATKNYVDTEILALDLDSLSDVIITTPANNEIIQFDGANWVNQVLTVPAGSEITQGNSSVSVIDTGVGRVETTIDSVLKFNVEQSQTTSFNPLIMSGQQIRNLGTPAVDTDATTKVYVDDLFALAPTDLDGLTDVTITTPLVNQILVNNGSGQFINQLITKTQLPSEIAYEDEVNTFTQNNIFSAGLQVNVDQALDMSGGFILDTKYMDFEEQGSTPADPALDDVRMFLEPAPSFGTDNPQLVVLINREGSITKKPISTSETIFALQQFTNGMVTDETGVRLSDNNPTIRVQMFNEANSANTYDVILEGDIFTIASPDSSPNNQNTIELTEGTDAVPVKHFVFIEIQLGVPVMVSNTVSFPTGTQDFVVVGTFTLQSRVSIFANSATGIPYAVNSPDYEIKDADIRGHLAHINDRLVELDAAYVSDIALTTSPLVGAGTLTAVTYSSTAGRSFELHPEGVEAFDITLATDIALVFNDGNVPGELTRVVNLSADLIGMLCGDGADLMFSSNNDTANLVLYTIHNDNEPNTTNYGINLPQTQYSNDDAAAIADSSNFALKNVSLTLKGITLLIAEIVIKFTTGGNYEVLAVKDLRGQIPGAAGGSGGGGAGASQLNDLTDVTINTPLINESLINDGAGQWVNKLTPQFETVNTWTSNQVYTPFAIGTGPSGTDGQFYTELIDATNTGLFVNLQVAGVVTKLRLA